MIAKVEPLTPARALRGPFDYRVPTEMGGVDVGSMLVVPFGRRRIVGVVVDMAERSELPDERLFEPLVALERELPAELLRLGLWVADEYCSTPARGLALVLPPGTGMGARPRVRSRTALVATLTELGYDALAGVGRLGSRQRAVLDALAAGAGPAAQVARAAGGDHGTLRALEARGLVTLDRAELRRRPRIRQVGAAAGPGPRLTEPQRAALGAIVERMDRPDGDRRVLLHGVTGSGKTEVYLRAVEAALARSRSAIVLVPEIALTPQTAGRFRERFGDTVAILHSKLGAGERYDEWSRLRSGAARVCVGPRSAVFAPLERVGLIVVDEEHDPSYKQDGDPRYDARHVAEHRARESGAALVAGSATPRLESWHRLPRVEIPERVDGRALPPIEVLGMAGLDGPLHPRTREALDCVRAERQKAIVLLNRRGWSNFLSCRTCGRVWGCPECDVSLVLHRAVGRLACHHCGHGERVPGACPDCGSVSVARHGAGTERLEELLAAAIAPLPVFRLDSDTHARSDALERFDAAPAGVLVGTQMVAKGHDFPDVTLGVAIDADATLRFPDFRAEERTFALVAQLAGRSGRGPRGGRVLVQALDPGARSLRHAAAHDAASFLAEERERREKLGYPPFGDLIRVVCTSHAPGAETAAAEAIRARLASAPARPSVLGPAPLFRLKGRDRAQVVVRSRDRAAAIEAVRAAVDAAALERAHRGVTFAVDVDPQ